MEVSWTHRDFPGHAAFVRFIPNLPVLQPEEKAGEKFGALAAGVGDQFIHC